MALPTATQRGHAHSHILVTRASHACDQFDSFVRLTFLVLSFSVSLCSPSFSDVQGWYDTADAGIIDKEGYVFVMARTDDVLNVAGHRLSSGQIEEVLCDHPSVAESAVVAVPDDLKGHVPVGLVVLKTGQQLPEEQIEREIVAAVRKRVGAVACLHQVIVVARLPKTRSGKVLRNVMRAMAEGKTHIPVPPTIEDASVLHEVHTKLHSKGIGNKPDPLFPAEADL